MTELELVLVTWHDATELAAGWHSIEDISKHKIAICKTAGWLISNDEERIIIASTVEGDPNQLSGGSVHAIPKDWCTSIQKLSTYTSPHYKME